MMRECTDIKYWKGKLKEIIIYVMEKYNMNSVQICQLLDIEYKEFEDIMYDM